MAVELEYKFTLDAAPEAAALEALLHGAGFSAEVRPPRLQHDRYLDTRAGALERAGLALRLRSFGETRLVTLKRKGSSEGGLHRREELELPFTGDWPQEVREGLRGLADPDTLGSVADLFAERQRFVITRAGRALAELSCDEVRAVHPGGASVRFREAELEALTADEGTLAHLAGILREGLGLAPSTVNKLERARALLLEKGAGEDG